MRHADKINIHAHPNVYFRMPLTADVLKLNGDNSVARFIPEAHYLINSLVNVHLHDGFFLWRRPFLMQ